MINNDINITIDCILHYTIIHFIILCLLILLGIDFLC